MFPNTDGPLLRPTLLKHRVSKMDKPTVSSLRGLADDADCEMPSTVYLGWNRTAVSAFISKYATVDWNAHQMDPPLGLIDTANNADMFEAVFMDRVAHKLDAVTRDGNHAFVCTHHVSLGRLIDVMRCLASESWMRIVLEEGPPLVGKLAKVTAVAYGKPHALFVAEHILFD